MRFPSTIFRRLAVIATCGVGAAVCLVAASNGYMVWRAQERIFRNPAELSRCEVGVVLGTSPRLAGKWANPFFEGRMDAAAELYRKGVVRKLLVTGDNSHRGYDEPTAMKESLVARGVPAIAIVCDYAGFRTLDSMARAAEVFGLEKTIVISDGFHLPRTLFLADAWGLRAQGFASREVPLKWSMKTIVREVIARPAAMVDVYVLHTKPHFTGPKETVRLAAVE